MAHYIKELISQGEHQRLDFKFEISDSRKIARTLVAFANTDGGTLLIGVKDNGNIAGVRSDEEYYMLDAAAKIYCKPNVEFQVVKWIVDGKVVLEAKITKGETKSYFAKVEHNKWVAFVRVDDENIVASSIHLKVWKMKKQREGMLIEYSKTEKMLLNLLETDSPISLSKFCRKAMISRRNGEHILAKLISIGVLDLVFSEQQFRFRLKNEKTPEPSRLSGCI